MNVLFVDYVKLTTFRLFISEQGDVCAQTYLL